MDKTPSEMTEKLGGNNKNASFARGSIAARAEVEGAFQAR